MEDEDSSSVAQDFDSQCRRDLEFSDSLGSNGDGALTRNQFVALVNLRAQQLVASTFVDLPAELQALFEEWSSSPSGSAEATTTATVVLFDLDNDDTATNERNHANIFRLAKSAQDDDDNKKILASTVCQEVTKALEALSNDASMEEQPAASIPTPVDNDNNTNDDEDNNNNNQPESETSESTSSSEAGQYELLLRRFCLQALSFADSDNDGQLSESEYVVFVNLLGKQEVGTSFSSLPDGFQAIYYEQSDSENQFIDMGDMDPISDPDALPDTLLPLCLEAKNEVDSFTSVLTGDGNNVLNDDQRVTNTTTDLYMTATSSEPTSTTTTTNPPLAASTESPSTIPNEESTVTEISTLVPTSNDVSAPSTVSTSTELPDKEAASTPPSTTFPPSTNIAPTIQVLPPLISEFLESYKSASISLFLPMAWLLFLPGLVVFY